MGGTRGPLGQTEEDGSDSAFSLDQRTVCSIRRRSDSTSIATSNPSRTSSSTMSIQPLAGLLTATSVCDRHRGWRDGAPVERGEQLVHVFSHRSFDAPPEVAP